MHTWHQTEKRCLYLLFSSSVLSLSVCADENMFLHWGWVGGSRMIDHIITLAMCLNVSDMWVLRNVTSQMNYWSLNAVLLGVKIPVNWQSRTRIYTSWGAVSHGLYLVTVDAVVDRPGRLKILQHSLLEALRQVMDAYEVLEVFGSGVVLGPAWVHPLDNGCHIAKDQRVHECCREERKG